MNDGRIRALLAVGLFVVGAVSVQRSAVAQSEKGERERGESSAMDGGKAADDPRRERKKDSEQAKKSAPAITPSVAIEVAEEPLTLMGSVIKPGPLPKSYVLGPFQALRISKEDVVGSVSYVTPIAWYQGKPFERVCGPIQDVKGRSVFMYQPQVMTFCLDAGVTRPVVTLEAGPPGKPEDLDGIDTSPGANAGRE